MPTLWSSATLTLDLYTGARTLDRVSLYLCRLCLTQLDPLFLAIVVYLTLDTATQYVCSHVGPHGNKGT